MKHSKSIKLLNNSPLKMALTATFKNTLSLFPKLARKNWQKNQLKEIRNHDRKD